MASLIRSDLWVSVFVRRHNDVGHICVIARRGDPLAGQIFIEIDHLNGTSSLYTPAPSALRQEESADRVFQCRFDHVEPEKIHERIVRESDFDPDLWVVSLEMRGGDPGISLVAA